MPTLPRDWILPVSNILPTVTVRMMPAERTSVLVALPTMVTLPRLPCSDSTIRFVASPTMRMVPITARPCCVGRPVATIVLSVTLPSAPPARRLARVVTEPIALAVISPEIAPAVRLPIWRPQ